MAPRSIFHHISFRSTILVSYLLYFAIFYFQFHKPKIPKILLYSLSISIRSHVANNREGIDNPFIALGAWLVFVCAVIRLVERCLLLDWYLGSQTEGNTYATLLHHPFLLKGKPNHAQEVAVGKTWNKGTHSPHVVQPCVWCVLQDVSERCQN